MINIFDQNWLEDFFRINENGRLVRRESVIREFKQEFNWASKDSKSKYAKSMAAFANNRGGCLIFGVKDSPHDVVGISNFFDTDDEAISTFINENYSPSIEFERNEYVVNGKVIGILHVLENKNKPVICIKDSTNAYCSDIYYRYGAKSSKIKPGDLMFLLNEIRENASRKWRDVFEKCATVGIDNVGVLDTQTGEIRSHANTFILDDALLKQIQFVDKYSEKSDGAPALRIIGEIPDAARVVTKSRPLYDEDLFKAFCTGELVASAQDYVRMILYKTTPFFPVYFLFDALGMTISEARQFVDDISITHANKQKLIKRLDDANDMHNKYALYVLGRTPTGEKRQKYFDKIVGVDLFEINSVEDAKVVIESIFSLRGDVYDHSFSSNILIQLMNLYVEFNHIQRGHFRLCLTYIDAMFFRSKIDPAFSALS